MYFYGSSNALIMPENTFLTLFRLFPFCRRPKKKMTLKDRPCLAFTPKPKTFWVKWTSRCLLYFRGTQKMWTKFWSGTKSSWSRRSTFFLCLVNDSSPENSVLFISYKFRIWWRFFLSCTQPKAKYRSQIICKLSQATKSRCTRTLLNVLKFKRTVLSSTVIWIQSRFTRKITFPPNFFPLSSKLSAFE